LGVDKNNIKVIDENKTEPWRWNNALKKHTPARIARHCAKTKCVDPAKNQGNCTPYKKLNPARKMAVGEWVDWQTFSNWNTGCWAFDSSHTHCGGGKELQYSRVENNNIPSESNLNYNILNGNDIINYAGVKEIKHGNSDDVKEMKGGNSQILLDPEKNQIVIKLTNGQPFLDSDGKYNGTYEYEGEIYDNNEIYTMNYDYIHSIKDSVDLGYDTNLEYICGYMWIF
tara:strand:- start:31 stop:711 length:681 start_codon:yes stop_codon:yes gene_type:complete